MIARKRMILAALALIIATPIVQAEWSYREDVDPVTDEIDKSLFGLASDGSTILMISCHAGRPRVSVITNNLFYTDRNDLVEVTTRVDKNEPVTSQWHGNSAQHFLISREPNEALVYDMKKGNRLIVRTSDELTNIDTYFFGLAGVTAGMSKLPCNPQGRSSEVASQSTEEPYKLPEKPTSNDVKKALEGLFN